MDNSNSTNPDRFCKIALDMGFIDEKQYREALVDQVSNDTASRLRPQRLIGEVLLEKGWLTNKQVELVLERLRS